MATWKKIITSGSNADLNTITASAVSFPNDAISGDVITGGTIGSTTISALAGDLSLGDNNITNVGDINADSISVDAAGTGLDIVFGGNTTKNKITLTDNLADALNITEGSNSYIKFTTTNSSEKILVSKDTDFLGNVSASLGSTGSFSCFIGDGSQLTGVAQDIDTLSAFSGVPHATDDEFLISDNGTEKRATMTMVANGGFALVSGDATIAAGGALTNAAAQTNITSLLATDIKIGEDDQTKIDFETADEIHFYAANVEQVYLADNIFGPQSDSDVDLGTTGVRWKDAYIDTITTTGDVDVLGNIELGHASDTTIARASAGQITVEGTAVLLAGDVTGVTSLLATDIKIGEDDETKIDFETANEIHFYAANVHQVKLVDNAFTPQADSDVDLGASGTFWKDAYIDTITTTGAVTIGGDLTVNGTTTTVATTNLDVKDQFILLGSGSSAANLDVGIIAQSGSVAGTGSALYHDISDERWAVAKDIGNNMTSSTAPASFVTTVKVTTDSPGAGEYGIGEMHIDSNEDDGAGNGTIYIRTA